MCKAMMYGREHHTIKRVRRRSTDLPKLEVLVSPTSFRLGGHSVCFLHLFTARWGQYTIISWGDSKTDDSTFHGLIGGSLVLPGHFPADISPEVNFGIIADLQEMYFR